MDRGFVKNIKIKIENKLKCDTDSNGLINIQNIEWGNYYLKETKAIEGYERIDSKFCFTVNRDTFKNNSDTVTKVLNEDTGEETSVIRNNKKLGKVTLIKYAYDASGNETTNTLEGAVYELYSADGTLVNEYTTDEEGKIVVENLDWDSYYFQEKQAPDGFGLSDKKISFVINSRNVDFEQELKAYDKLESGEITINKVINKDDIYKAHGNSTFIFKIVGKDAGEEKVTYYRTATFTEKDIVAADEYGNINKTIKITDIDPYIYEVTEEDNYRFDIETITPNSVNAEVNGDIGTITLSGVQNKGEITFINKKQTNSLLTDATLITNVTQTEFYVVGIKVNIKQNKYAINTELTKDDFTFTLLYSGGQEVEVDPSILDSVLLDGGTTYTKTEAGDYIINVKTIYRGKTYEEQIATKWILPNDYFTYIALTKNTICITGINSEYQAPKVLYIPSKYNEYNVQQVGDTMTNWYKGLLNCSNVEEVEIAEGVKVIGQFAFYQCTKLTSVKIPDTVTKIDSYAFYGCGNLTSIEIPEGVTSIGTAVFYNCTSLTSINIPEGITSIGSETFYNCTGLTSIEIPEGVTSIGSSAFNGCSRLTSMEIPEGVTSIGSYAFSNCIRLTSIEIPEGVTSIGDKAFYYCTGLTSINIPEGITSIGSETFCHCEGLTSIEIPEGVTSIGSSAFIGCKGLTSINIPEGVTSIASETFFNCTSLISIDIPESLTSIGKRAFGSCSSLSTINYHGTPEQFAAISIDNDYNYNGYFTNATVNYITD